MYSFNESDLTYFSFKWCTLSDISLWIKLKPQTLSLIWYRSSVLNMIFWIYFGRNQTACTHQHVQFFEMCSLNLRIRLSGRAIERSYFLFHIKRNLVCSRWHRRLRSLPADIPRFRCGGRQPFCARGLQLFQLWDRKQWWGHTLPLMNLVGANVITCCFLTSLFSITILVVIFRSFTAFCSWPFGGPVYLGPIQQRVDQPYTIATRHDTKRSCSTRLLVV